MIIQLRDKQKTVARPEDVHNILQSILRAEDLVDQDREHFWVFQLNVRNQIQKLELISLGTLTTSIVHPREVFTKAIADRCCSILIAHNHPSGEVDPSEDDIEITERLANSGQILGIEVVDHVITTSNGFYSFNREGRI